MKRWIGWIGWIGAILPNVLVISVIAQEMSYELLLPPAPFDPLQEVPSVAPSLSADSTGRLFIVQFVGQPLSEYGEEIVGLGGTVYGGLHNKSRIVKMDEATRAEVEALAYVRWVGPYHSAYRLEAYLRENIDQGETLFPLQVYNIAVFEPGPSQKTPVAERIEQLGGVVTVIPDNGYLLFARLTPQQLLSVIHWDEVAFVDRWSPPCVSMNIARDNSISGANYVENIAPGYLGAGVRGEIMDNYLYTGHVAFQLISGVREPPILHGPQGFTTSHGTNVYGCAFGDGTNASPASAKGVLPQAQGIFADYCRLWESVAGGSPMQGSCLAENIPVDDRRDRYEHTAELVDPNGTLKAVFQSNSWGIGHGSWYNLTSRQMDDILFQHDLLACQAQGNLGNTTSHFEAWAKNIVSVGGVHHYNNLLKGDDLWYDPEFLDDQSVPYYASIGPASDGRIKPDFTHFFDNVYTTAGGDSSYFPLFSGTSAATPITCGHFGLFFQMWADGIFGNTLLDPNCDPEVENCVFKNRPHMTTAKAMMINTASPYPFVGSAESVDFTRTHQGWGLVQVGRLHILRDRFPIIVDETQVLIQDETVTYNVNVPPGWHALRATLVYADPRRNPPVETGPQAVNDLNLRVIAPNGITSWQGNCGLREGNWSSPVCAPNRPIISDQSVLVIDTVENVFVQISSSGTWTVEVKAPVIQGDGHLETPELDVDFALVVSIDSDCNINGASDADDLLGNPPAALDCNSNEVPDSCDISSGTSDDCDANGIPDECQAFGMPVRGCCLPDAEGTCIETTECRCDELGGTYISSMYTCPPVSICAMNIITPPEE